MEHCKQLRLCLLAEPPLNQPRHRKYYENRTIPILMYILT